ncbi:MAG: hypothetical protein DSM106950_16390 [Stigonema ocellatum SAG 48.90 = DSM 106950]|nr:hypothetical protein [Stigonema ocellatum SAG 48.90 = DSM 106950]
MGNGEGGNGEWGMGNGEKNIEFLFFFTPYSLLPTPHSLLSTPHSYFDNCSESFWE